jgi:hypothetical protein
MNKVRIAIVLILLLGILFSGCITEQPKTDTTSKTVSEKEVWHNFGNLLSPGHYLKKGSEDVQKMFWNDIQDLIIGLVDIMPDYDSNPLKTITDAIDIAINGSHIDDELAFAQVDCAPIMLEISDTGNTMMLPEALKHFGDLYGDGNTNTNPTLDDLKGAKSKAECYKQKFSNIEEGKYLSQLTTDLEKLLDSKIQTMEKSVDSVQKLKSGEPKTTVTSVGTVAATTKVTPKITSKSSQMADATLDADVVYLDVLCSNDPHSPYQSKCSDKGESLYSYANCGGCSYITKKLHMGRDGDALFLKATFDKDPYLEGDALFYVDIGVDDFREGGRPFRIEVKENSARILAAENYRRKDFIDNLNKKETQEFPITFFNGGSTLVIKVGGLYKVLNDRANQDDRLRLFTEIDVSNGGVTKSIGDLLKQLQ